MTEKLRTFDVANYLKTEADIAAYLNACAEDNDAVLMAAALGQVARARGNMTAIARKAGLSRAGLYKALSSEGNPTLSTVSAVASAMGLKLLFAAEAKRQTRRAA